MPRKSSICNVLEVFGLFYTIHPSRLVYLSLRATCTHLQLGFYMKPDDFKLVAPREGLWLSMRIAWTEFRTDGSSRCNTPSCTAADADLDAL